MSNPQIVYAITLRNLNAFLASGTDRAYKANDILSTVANDMVDKVKDTAVESLMRGTFGKDGHAEAIAYAVGTYHAYGRR